MAYRKSGYRGYGYSKRRPYARPCYYSRRKPASWAGTASKALRLATHVASIVNSELKHYDETNTVTPNTTGALSSIIAGITAGTGTTNFEGNSILLKKINATGSVQMNASATSTRVRMWIIQDLQANQSTFPNFTNIFDSNSLNTLMNIDAYPGRFKILWQRRLVVDSNYPERMFKFNLKMSKHIKFNGTNVSKNDMYFCYIADEATNTPTVQLTTRLRFYDN